MLERSYRCAALTARRSGSNFYRSFSLLPRDKRRAMTALYAFARRTDDLGDSGGTAAERQRNLLAWRAVTLQVLNCNNPTAIEYERDPALPAVIRESASNLLPALADAAQRYAIPHQHLIEIIDGVIADQTHTGYESFEELEHYCYLVASAVGLACMHVWQHAPELPRAAAVDCGIAFQLTNILRDIHEDANSGRIYLPRQCWASRGLAEADFRSAAPPPAMTEIILDVAARARSQFVRGWEVYEHLHPDGRGMFSMMWHTYWMLLDRIEAEPASVFRRRVRLGHSDRLWIAASHFLGPWLRRLRPETRIATSAEPASDEPGGLIRNDRRHSEPRPGNRRRAVIVSGPASERTE